MNLDLAIKVVKEAGYRVSRVRRDHPPSQIEEIRRLRTMRRSYTDIAAAMDMTKGQVAGIIYRNDL